MLISGFSSPKVLLLGVGIVSTIVVAAGKAPGVAAGPRPTIPMIHAQHPNAAAGYSGSVSGAILGAQNNATTPAFGVFGVEGFVPYDVGGVGLLGYAQAAKSYGVYGVTFGANGTGVYGTADSATPAPSSTANSATESIGVVGNSAAGDGVYGSTSFGAGSSFTTNPIGGVMGVDAIATSGPSENNGVVGMTTYGAFGVDGIGGASAAGGVSGYSPNSLGVYGLSDSGYGAAGLSTSGDGVLGSSSATDVDSGGGVFDGTYISLLAQTQTSDGSTSYPFDVRNATNNDVFYIDNTGDTYVYGTLYLANGQSTFARTRSAGVHATTYAATTSKPTLEDVGEGELTGGQAFVKLDPTFAAAIDSTTPYHVFVTPEGDTRGVYVAQKSMSGFAVRENQGGRSTTSFSYRIVANQFGQTDRRMALQPDSMTARPLNGKHLGARHAQLELQELQKRSHHVATFSHFVPRPIDNSRVR